MTENNLPLLFVNPELQFNLELDTQNRINKIQSELKLPTNELNFNVGNNTVYNSDYKPTFDFEKNLVNNGETLFEAQFSSDAAKAAKARELMNKKLDQDFVLANNLRTPTVTPVESTKRYTSEKQGFLPGTDNEDFFYEQNWETKGNINKFTTATGNFLGRVGVGAVSKFGQGFGYLGSMIANIGENDYWGKVADNGFSKYLEEFEEDRKQDIFKVYKSADYDNKGFFDKMKDATFWQEDVADGVAFMASALIPMGILGKAGQAAKFGRLAILGTDIAATTTVGRLAGTGVEFLTGSKNILGVTGHVYSVASEAAFEASDVYKQNKAKFIKQGFSEQEAGKLAGEKASQTYLGNVAVLTFSNAFENKMMQKVLNRGVNTETRQILNYGDDLAINAEVANTKLGRFLADNTWGKRLDFYGKAAGKGFIAEGLWEENAQLAITRMAEGEYEAKERGTGYVRTKEAGNFINQLYTNTKDALTGKDLEAETSIGIGALIGIGGGTITSLLSRERSKEEKSRLQTITELTTARNNWLKNDIYATKADGTFVIENGSLVIDPIKVAARDEKLATMASKLNLAKELIDKPEFKSYLERSAFTDFALAHIKNGSIDYLIDKLKNWDTKDAETLAAYGFSQDPQLDISPAKFAEIAKDLNDIYKASQDAKFNKPEGMKTSDAINLSFLAKEGIFNQKANIFHINSILDNGFKQFDDPKFDAYKALKNELKSIEDSLTLSLNDTTGVSKAQEDQKKDVEKRIEDYEKDPNNKDIVEEYNQLNSERESLKSALVPFEEKLKLLTNPDLGLIAAFSTIEKVSTEVENKQKEAAKEEEKKPIIVTINGKQYTSIEDIEQDVKDGVITQDQVDTALKSNQQREEDKDYIIIKVGNKFKIQFASIIYPVAFDDEKAAIKIASHVKKENDKFVINIVGLDQSLYDDVYNLVSFLNKNITITPAVNTKEQLDALDKIKRLIEDGEKTTLVEETPELESHYSFLGKLYQRVSTFVGNTIAFITKDDVTNLKNSVVVGNYFDTFARAYFNNPNLTIEEFETALKARRDYKQYENIDTVKIYDENKKRFDEIRTQLKKKHKDENLMFIADEIFVHQDFDNGKFNGVAGTLDMLVIDSTGKVFVYDFKTKKENNTKFPVTPESLKKEFKGETSQEKWGRQQTQYAKMLKDTFGYLPSINIVVIPVIYDSTDYEGEVVKDEIDAFNPSPKLTRLAKTKPFLYELPYTEIKKKVDPAKKSILEIKKEELQALKDKNLEDTGDVFDHVTSTPRADGQFTAFYLITKKLTVHPTHQDAIDYIIALYDAEFQFLQDFENLKSLEELKNYWNNLTDEQKVKYQDIYDELSTTLKSETEGDLSENELNNIFGLPQNPPGPPPGSSPAPEDLEEEKKPEPEEKPEEEPEPEDLDEDTDDNVVFSGDMGFERLVKIDTPLTTIGQNVKKRPNGTDEIEFADSDIPYRNSTDDAYDIAISDIIRQMGKDSLIGNTLSNTDMFKIVLIKDTEALKKARGVDITTEDGMVAVIIEKSTGKMLRIKDVLEDSDMTAAVVFTINEKQFDPDVDDDYNERVQARVLRGDDPKMVKAYFKQEQDALKAARKAIVEGRIKETEITIVNNTNGIYFLNKVQQGKKVVPYPYLLKRLFSKKEIDIRVEMDALSQAKGRVYVTVNGDEIPVMTQKLFNVILPGNIPANEFIKNSLLETMSFEDAQQRKHILYVLANIKTGEGNKVVYSYDSKLKRLIPNINEKVVDLPTFNELVDKSYLNVKTGILNKEIRLIETENPVNYNDFLKDYLTTDLSPMKENGEFKIKPINPYFNFSFNYPDEFKNPEVEIKKATKKETKINKKDEIAIEDEVDFGSLLSKKADADNFSLPPTNTEGTKPEC